MATRDCARPPGYFDLVLCCAIPICACSTRRVAFAFSADHAGAMYLQHNPEVSQGLFKGGRNSVCDDWARMALALKIRIT